MATNPQQQFLADNRKKLEEERKKVTAPVAVPPAGKQYVRQPDGTDKIFDIPGYKAPAAVPATPGVFTNKTTGQTTNAQGQSVDATGKVIVEPVQTTQEQYPGSTRYDQQGNQLPGAVLTGREQLSALGEQLFPGEKTVYGSLEEEIKAMTDAQKKEKEALRRDIDVANAADELAVSDAKRASERAIEGTNATFAQSRNAPTSATNPQIASEFAQITNQRIGSAIAQKENARIRRESLMGQLEQAQREGRAARVIELQNEISAAQAAEAEAESSLLDAQMAASEEARNVQTQNNANLKAFTDMVGTGAVLTPDSILQLSKTMNIPFESAYDFYAGSQAIRDDKTLDAETKKIALAQKAQELQDTIDGIATTEARNINYLNKQTQAWAAQGVAGEELDQMRNELKQQLGITDQSDPMYQLKLEAARLDNKIKQNEANGVLVNPLDQAQYAKIMNELNQTTGNNPVYLPNGKYAVAPSGSGVSVQATVGANGGQCGRFVNDVFGKSIMGDSIADKMKNVDKSIVVPTPGMAFVMYTAGASAANGHTGIVERVNDDGTMDVIDSNWGSNEKIQRRTMPISSAAGFVAPPGGKLLNGNTAGVNINAQEVSNTVKLLAKTSDKKDVENTINTYVQNGNTKGLQDYVTRIAFEDLPAADQTKYLLRSNLVNRGNELVEKMKEFEENGGDLGIFNGSYVTTTNKVGSMGDSGQQEIAQSILLMLEDFGRAQTGAAIQDFEKKTFASILPGLYDGGELAAAKVKAFAKAYESDTRNALKFKLGEQVFDQVYGSSMDEGISQRTKDAYNKTLGLLTGGKVSVEDDTALLKDIHAGTTVDAKKSVWDSI